MRVLESIGFGVVCGTLAYAALAGCGCTSGAFVALCAATALWLMRVLR